MMRDEPSLTAIRTDSPAAVDTLPPRTCPFTHPRPARPRRPRTPADTHGSARGARTAAAPATRVAAEPGRNRLCRADSRCRGRTYTCSPAFHPKAVVAYERMFPPAHDTVNGHGGPASADRAGTVKGPPAPRAPRAAGILRLVRDFLLLEDDYDVGWEAEYAKEDQAPGLRLAEGGAVPARCPAAAQRRLRRGRRARRPGQPRATPQVCLCDLRAGVSRRATACTRDQHCASDNDIGSTTNGG
jgi:hypothetical protein